MKSKTVTIYKTDAVNKNGVYIPHDVLKESIENIDKPIMGRLCPDYYGVDINLADVSHKCANFRVNDDKREITCEISTMNNHYGKLAETLFDSLVPNACSGCIVDDDGKITTHKLISVDLVLK